MCHLRRLLEYTRILLTLVENQSAYEIINLHVFPSHPVLNCFLLEQPILTPDTGQHSLLCHVVRITFPIILHMLDQFRPSFDTSVIPTNERFLAGTTPKRIFDLRVFDACSAILVLPFGNHFFPTILKEKDGQSLVCFRHYLNDMAVDIAFSTDDDFMLMLSPQLFM